MKLDKQGRTRPVKYLTKTRLKIQTFCLPLSHLHTNTNSCPKESKFTLDVGLVDENFTHSYVIFILYFEHNTIKYIFIYLILTH
jgi:hypothetical protein